MLTSPLPPTLSQLPSPPSQISSSPQSPPPTLLPAPQVYNLTPPPPSSIATASLKPSEATETEPNNHAHQEEIRNTSQGNASPTTKPEQAQVPSDHHDNPSDDIKGKTAHNSGDNHHGNRNSSNSSDCNCNFGPGNDSKVVYTLNSKDDSMCNDGADTTSSSDNVFCSADTHNNIDCGNNAFPIPNIDVTSITNHGSSDCDHPHNPTSTSNVSKCKLVHGPGGNSLKAKDGASRDDDDSISISSGIVSRAADSHRSCNRNRDKSFSTALQVDIITDTARRPLSPQHLADSLNVDHAQDITRTPPAQCLDTFDNASSSSNTFHIANNPHSHDHDPDEFVPTVPDADPGLKFVQVDRPISDDIPSPRPTDNLPALLCADSNCANAAQRALLPPSLHLVVHPLDIDHTRPSTPDITHTLLALHIDSNSDDGNSIVDASHQTPPFTAPPRIKPEEPPPARPQDKAASPPTPKVVQGFT
jgi:hypothetical protein